MHASTESPVTSLNILPANNVPTVNTLATVATPTLPIAVSSTSSLVTVRTFVTTSSYDTTNLTCTPAEKKTVPGTGSQAKPPTPEQHYHQIPLLYNFGTAEKKVLNDFKIEGSEMDSKYGIQEKMSPNNGRLEYSIMVAFDVNNSEQFAFVEAMAKIHNGCAYILQQLKGAVKMFSYDPKMSEATGFKSPVYRPRDEVTGEEIVGRSPILFLKLFKRGKAPMTEQTLFTGPDGKAIPWALLSSVEMKFIPLIHVKRIYIGGGKAFLQMEIVSAIVTSLRARNTSNTQTDTFARVRDQNPELLDLFSAQIAKLQADRQNLLLGNDLGKDGETEPDKPTFDGIKPTNVNKPVPGVPTMNDLTNSAPQRNNNVGVPTLQFN